MKADAEKLAALYDEMFDQEDRFAEETDTTGYVTITKRNAAQVLDLPPGGTFSSYITPNYISVSSIKLGETALDEDILKKVIERYDQDAQKKAVTEPNKKAKALPVFKSEADLEFYLVISDLHIPFHLEDELEALIEEHASMNYNLVIVGDFLDCHDISTFPKSHAVGLNNEVAIAKKYLADWCAKFKKVYLIAGNHEKRMASYIRKRVSPEVVTLVEDDILNLIVNDLKLPNLVYTPGDTTNWYMQIDNVVLCHPDDYKKSTAGVLHTATSSVDYFDAYNPDANIIIMGHTHHMGMAVFRGRTVVESGCLCQRHDYAASGRLSYTPQANGYLNFVSIKGKVHFNDIKLTYLG